MVFFLFLFFLLFLFFHYFDFKLFLLLKVFPNRFDICKKKFESKLDKIYKVVLIYYRCLVVRCNIVYVSMRPSAVSRGE